MRTAESAASEALETLPGLDRMSVDVSIVVALALASAVAIRQGWVPLRVCGATALAFAAISAAPAVALVLMRGTSADTLADVWRSAPRTLFPAAQWLVLGFLALLVPRRWWERAAERPAVDHTPPDRPSLTPAR